MTQRERAPPPGAYRGGVEVVRCWFVDGGLMVVIWRGFPWIERPEAIGMLLVDLARHAARMFADQKIAVEAVGLGAIRATFEEAWNNRAGERPDAISVNWSDTAQPPRISELSVPNVGQAGESGEVMRVWRTEAGIEVAMVPIWDEPRNWGVLLFDLARGLALAFEGRNEGSPFAVSMTHIRSGFEAEWSRPTDMGTTVASRLL